MILDNNIKEYELEGRPGESVEVYVARRIAENTSFSFKNRIEAIMPATKFLHTVVTRSYRMRNTAHNRSSRIRMRQERAIIR